MLNFRFLPGLIPFSLCITHVFGVIYTQSDSHTGVGFLKSFSFETTPDPTHGRVNFVDADTAALKNLSFGHSDHFILRADSKTVLPPGGPGRDSFRLHSNKHYSTSVMVFNIRHMPTGCGTWPAVWTVGDDWPNNGEIDVLEGVNDQGPNQSTLHTRTGCSMPVARTQTGSALGNNCDVFATGNAGCAVKMSDTRSYGTIFNHKGGGFYVVERTPKFIKVWFWSREATNIPKDVLNGETTVNTDHWGTPRAFFPSDSCDIASHFGAHRIIINLTFCGDFAGNSAIYAASGCPSTCVDFVNRNPSAFEEAYFDFQWLKIYTL